MVQCNGTKENNNKHRCTCAWYTCNTHINQSKKKEENYRSRWEENMTENKVHGEAINQVEYEEPPEDKNKTQHVLCYGLNKHENHEQVQKEKEKQHGEIKTNLLDLKQYKNTS